MTKFEELELERRTNLRYIMEQYNCFFCFFLVQIIIVASLEV